MAEGRASPRRRAGGAFTLIELLVVVAILALLLAVLIPYLSKARELARRAVCMGNLRSLSQACHGFANTRSGRFPGGALDIGGGNGVGWSEVLNAEWYRSRTIANFFWGWPLPRYTKNCILCPDTHPYRTRSSTPYQYSSDAGGATDVSLATYQTYPNPGGAYGLEIDPKRVQTMYDQYWGVTYRTLGEYHLGAQVDKFARPSYTYLIFESEYNGLDVGNAWPFTPSTVTLNAGTNPTYAPWVAQAGQSVQEYFAFRHTLPIDLGLYQRQATMCSLFVDGHVEIMGPNQDVCSVGRLLANPYP